MMIDIKRSPIVRSRRGMKIRKKGISRGMQETRVLNLHTSLRKVTCKTVNAEPRVIPYVIHIPRIPLCIIPSIASCVALHPLSRRTNHQPSNRSYVHWRTPRQTDIPHHRPRAFPPLKQLFSAAAASAREEVAARDRFKVLLPQPRARARSVFIPTPLAAFCRAYSRNSAGGIYNTFMRSRARPEGFCDHSCCGCCYARDFKKPLCAPRESDAACGAAQRWVSKWILRRSGQQLIVLPCGFFYSLPGHVTMRIGGFWGIVVGAGSVVDFYWGFGVGNLKEATRSYDSSGRNSAPNFHASNLRLEL